MAVILALVVAVFLAGSLAVLLAVFAAAFVPVLLTVFVTVPLAVFVAMLLAVFLVSPDHPQPSRLLRLSPIHTEKAVGSRLSAMCAKEALTTASTLATAAHAGYCYRRAVRNHHFLAFDSIFGGDEQDLCGY